MFTLVLSIDNKLFKMLCQYVHVGVEEVHVERVIVAGVLASTLTDLL